MLALVTGANRGIGKEVARQLAELGAAGIVRAATLSDRGPSGGFFRDQRPISW